MNLGPGPIPPLPPSIRPANSATAIHIPREKLCWGGAAGGTLVRGRGGNTTVFPWSGHPLGAATLGPAYLSGGEPCPLSRLLSSKVFIYPPAMC